jgi:hypothetical protein
MEHSTLGTLVRMDNSINMIEIKNKFNDLVFISQIEN